MKIFISFDMEGTSGLTHQNQMSLRGGGEYEEGRKLLTGDINAAIRGALDAGADEILVADGHGSMRNILIEELDPAARIISGFPKPKDQMCGLDESFDGVLLIGYHAKASGEGLLTHSVDGIFESIKINGIEVGEVGLNAAIAGYYGVPVVAVSGDDKLKEEIEELNINAEYAEVKTCYGWGAANCLHPSKAQELIREQVKKAVLNTEAYNVFKVDGPIDLEITLGGVDGPQIADLATDVPGAIRVAPKTVLFKGMANILEALKAIRTICNASCVMTLNIYS